MRYVIEIEDELREWARGCLVPNSRRILVEAADYIANLESEARGNRIRAVAACPTPYAGQTTYAYADYSGASL